MEMRLRGKRMAFKVRLRVIKGYHNPDVAGKYPRRSTTDETDVLMSLKCRL